MAELTTYFQTILVASLTVLSIGTGAILAINHVAASRWSYSVAIRLSRSPWFLLLLGTSCVSFLNALGALLLLSAPRLGGFWGDLSWAISQTPNLVRTAVLLLLTVLFFIVALLAHARRARGEKLVELIIDRLRIDDLADRVIANMEPRWSHAHNQQYEQALETAQSRLRENLHRGLIPDYLTSFDEIVLASSQQGNRTVWKLALGSLERKSERWLLDGDFQRVAQRHESLGISAELPESIISEIAEHLSALRQAATTRRDRFLTLDVLRTQARLAEQLLQHEMWNESWVVLRDVLSHSRLAAQDGDPESVKVFCDFLDNVVDLVLKENNSSLWDEFCRWVWTVMPEAGRAAATVRVPRVIGVDDFVAQEAAWKQMRESLGWIQERYARHVEKAGDRNHARADFLLQAITHTIRDILGSEEVQPDDDRVKEMVSSLIYEMDHIVCPGAKAGCGHVVADGVRSLEATYEIVKDVQPDSARSVVSNLAWIGSHAASSAKARGQMAVPADEAELVGPIVASLKRLSGDEQVTRALGEVRLKAIGRDFEDEVRWFLASLEGEAR